MKMLNQDTDLFLTEIFSSVQGESSFVGLPTVFVRLSGCNLRCNWCDTPYSFSRGERWNFEALLQDILARKLKYICITGGEPLLQKNVLSLMEKLCDRERIVSIETGGSLPTDKIDPRVRIILDIKCPASAMHERNHWENLKRLRAHDEVKFVLQNRQDYDWAKDVCKKFQLFENEVNLLFSPVHDVLKSAELVEWILEDQIPVRLNLQTHKFIWEPSTRGV